MSGQQEGLLNVLQNAATTNGNGQSQWVGGFTGVQNVEIVETAGGTATVTLEGSFNSNGNWYAVGYQRIDAQATLTRSASGISVTASFKQVFQILDPYPVIRARISGVAAGGTVTVTLYRVSA